MSEKKPAVRVALSGYYGFDNAGDEAVLAGLIKAFQWDAGENALHWELTALSIDPAKTEADHKIRAAHRYKAGPLLRALAGCDLLASGGGSLLQDVTSKHSIFYYLGVVRAAQILGKRTMFIGQGIGPLLLPRSRRLTAYVARRCDAVAVRDPDSAQLLRAIGVTRPEITVTADPALLLGVESASYTASGAAVSLRAWGRNSAVLADTVAWACHAALGAPIVSSMLMSPSDAGIHDAFFEAFNQRLGLAPGKPHAQEPIPWHTLNQIASTTGLMIGMRLHALILAAAGGVPSVALAYDPKVVAFMQMTGQADAVYDIQAADSGKLAAIISRVWAERKERAERLRGLLPSLREAALLNERIAGGIFQSK